MNVRFTETVTAGLRKQFSRQRIHAAMTAGGKSVAQYLKQYYAKKDRAEPNQLGGDRTHFWNKIGDSVNTSPKVMGENVAILIADPRFRQKVRGGPIVPVRAKALTIPIHPAAHGRSARELGAKVGGLFILKTGNGEAFLAGKIRQKVTLYYLLRQRVVQMPWPGAIPPKRSLKWVFTHGIREYFRRVLRPTRP